MSVAGLLKYPVYFMYTKVYTHVHSSRKGKSSESWLHLAYWCVIHISRGRVFPRVIRVTRNEGKWRIRVQRLQIAEYFPEKNIRSNDEKTFT